MSSTVTASARAFNAGVSESFSIADNASLSIGDVDMLFAGWVYLDTTTTQQFIVGKWGGTADEYFCDFVTGANQFRWAAYTPGGTLHTVNSTTFGTPSDDTWYFLEFGYDAAADSMFIAVNRGARNTVGHAGGIRDSNSTFYFGSNNGSTAFLNGRMQAWNFWKGTIPSTATLDGIYAAGVGKFYKTLTTDEKTGMISSWDLVETSGTARDAHGTNTLTDNNTVTSAVGKVTYTAEDASQFTAANSEYLSHASNSDFNTGDIDFSFAGWAYLDSLATYRILFPSKWGPSAGSWEYILEFDTPNTFGWYVTSNGSTLAGVTSTLPAVAISNWYFVVCWHDSVNNVIRISVNDGTVYSTAHTTGVYAASGQEFSPGKTSSLYMSGRMANWGYWKKVLTAAEITQLYARGFGLDYTDFDAGLLTSLVGFWPLTEASGTRVDVHGSNDLTDNNTVTGAAGVVYDAPAVITFKPSMLLLGVG